MTSLQQVQARMAVAVLGDTDEAFVRGLVAGSGDARRRLDIYRNNFRLSLTRALIDNFPVTVAMVDECFFRFAADSFIRRHPPREPRLNLYGRELAAYLSAMPQLADYPHVPAVARLEWQILEVLAATSAAPAAFGDLARLGIAGAGARLLLQPALRLGVSRYPVAELWQSHQDGAEPAPPRASQKVHCHLVWRNGANVRLRQLASGDFAFLAALRRGLSIEQATARALRRDGLFDLAHQVIGLFEAGLVTAVTPPSSPTPKRS